MSEKSTVKIALFLHKESVESFNDCIKSDVLNSVEIYSTIDTLGIEGTIYVHHVQSKIPDWKYQLDKLSGIDITIPENTSNKAVVVFKHKNRYFSLTYGYGRSMLDDSKIVRNFGLIVAANLIDSEKLKSLNSMTIEDAIIDTQKQTSKYTNQNQLQVNKISEILKSLSGSPTQESVAKFLIGTDSLIATRKMNIIDIKTDINFYYDTYQKDDYKTNGFEWLDNVQVIKDAALKNNLHQILVNAIADNDPTLYIAPNKIIDWEKIDGFHITGVRNTNNEIDIDYEGYFAYIRRKEIKDVLTKLRNDKLMATNNSGEEVIISNVYDGLIYEIVHNEGKYLLCYGDWYEIDTTFYNQIKLKINSIPDADIKLPNCMHQEGESMYNKRVATACGHLLLDSQNYQPSEYGHSKIEPCDILTEDEQFLHIKKGRGSSKLSHLFAQGLVSARIFRSDPGFKTHINAVSNRVRNKDILTRNPSTHVHEIIFGIIDDREGPHSTILPFFSMVNLSQVVDELHRMNLRVSILRIGQESKIEA